MADNVKNFENTPKGPAPPAMPTMKCYVVPIEQMDQIRDCVREAPYKTAAPVVRLLQTLQVMDVPVKVQQG